MNNRPARPVAPSGIRSGRRPRTRAWLGLALLLAACSPAPFSVSPTQPVNPTPPTTPMEVPTYASEGLAPPLPCPDAALEGSLVRDDRWTVAVRDDEGRIVKVVWPDGFFARYGFSWVELVGPPGFVVARTQGEHLRIPGTASGSDTWLACGRIVQAATPIPWLTPWPTLDPSLPIGHEVTCGDNTPHFPVEALNASPDAHRTSGAASKALQVLLADRTVRNPDPDATAEGWRQVLSTSTDALFVATTSGSSRWLMVWLTSTGIGPSVDGWFFQSAGECRPELSFGPELRRAELLLDPAKPVRPSDRDVDLLIYELSCSSGRSPEGRIQAPILAYTADRVYVAISIKRLPGGQDCQGVDPYPYSVELSEPVGTRELYDAALVPAVPIVATQDGS